VKAFIFLAFSVLIHCYIFNFSLLRNGQEGLKKEPFLRNIKQSAVSNKSTGTTRNKKLIVDGFREPKLFAPKKLSAPEVSKLNYRDGLIHLIQSKAVYPDIARDLEQSGTVVVSVDLDKNGQVMNFKIQNRSEHELLNEAALKALDISLIYKPLPRVLHPYATFLVPIHFL
jgi:TonB family protein